MVSMPWRPGVTVLLLAAAVSAVEPLTPEMETIEAVDCGALMQTSQSQTAARSLNTEGFRLYKEGDLIPAARRFYCATQAAPRYAMAHYNYACVLSLFTANAFEKDKCTCDDTYTPAIEQHLTAAIRLDANRRARMLTDADFEAIRELPFYRRLAIPPGLPLEQVLARAGTFYGPAPGVYPASPEVVFDTTGRVMARSFSNEPGEIGFSPWLEGRYEVVGERELVITYPGREPLRSRVRMRFEEGVLVELEIDYAPHIVLTLQSGDCGV